MPHIDWSDFAVECLSYVVCVLQLIADCCDYVCVFGFGNVRSLMSNNERASAELNVPVFELEMTSAVPIHLIYSQPTGHTSCQPNACALVGTRSRAEVSPSGAFGSALGSRSPRSTLERCDALQHVARNIAHTANCMHEQIERDLSRGDMKNAVCTDEMIPMICDVDTRAHIPRA